MEIQEFQHPDCIWTWKSNAATERAGLWLPYLEGVAKVKAAVWRFDYKGGSVEVDLAKLDFIMLYGAAGQLSVEFLDALGQARVPFIIHRRNLQQPYVFYPAPASDDVDILTRQILARENLIKRCYIARCLIQARLENMVPTISLSRSLLGELRQCRSLEAIRALEAETSARYWRAWFAALGEAAVTRRSEHPLAATLDAGSMFLMGVVLRWLLFHKLSPCHGYMHVPTNYPSLVYDLMEPYRYGIEQATAEAWRHVGGADPKTLTGEALNRLKVWLDGTVYVPATRQYVRRKNLLHGAVLALRAYLLGESVRLVLPREGVKAGGRPPHTGYRLPGGRKQGDEIGKEVAGQRIR